MQFYDFAVQRMTLISAVVKTASKFTVYEPFNFQSIAAPNNCSWRRVKAFKSRIRQKTSFSETMRNAVQMYVENEFFMFLSLLFCNNNSATPFINFLSRHQTFDEFLIPFIPWICERFLLLLRRHVWFMSSICFLFKGQTGLEPYWTLLGVIHLHGGIYLSTSSIGLVSEN